MKLLYDIGVFIDSLPVAMVVMAVAVALVVTLGGLWVSLAAWLTAQDRGQ